MAQHLTAIRRARRIALLASPALTLALPAVAYADCTASGSAVTCSGTSAAYTNTASNLNVTVNSGSTVTGPLVIGATGTMSNAGTISGSTAAATVQFGDNATITNTGTITSSGSASASAAIVVGANSKVTNSGALTAVSTTPAVQFGINGQFINTTSATSAVAGNLVFGSISAGNTDISVVNFLNQNTAYGFTGNVIGFANLNLDNAGLWSGNITQTYGSSASQVLFKNDTGATYAGVISTGNATNVTNTGTMALYAGTVLGSVKNSVSTLTNGAGGALTIGTTSAAAQALVYGNFVQNATGALTMVVGPSSDGTLTAGTNFSQIYATNSTGLSGSTIAGAGSATLAGTLNLTATAGFYANNAAYKLILADTGITGNFTTFKVTNSQLFVTFVQANGTLASGDVCTNGVCTIAGSSTQMAYEVVANRVSYVTGLTNAGITDPNILSIATGMGGGVAGTGGLVAVATASPSSDAAAFIGTVDILGKDDAWAFFRSISPAPYAAYAVALRDQANAFTRAIDLRMTDQNSDHPEDGWWFSGQGEFDIAPKTGDRSSSKLIGFTGGYDFSGPHHVFGAAATISWDSLKYAPGTMSGTNRDVALAAYGGYNLGPIHLTGQLAYNFGHLSANKSIWLGSSASRSTHAGSAEHLLKATGTAGFQLTARGVKVEPFVGIDYANGKVNGFTEANAGAADLVVSAISANRTDLLAGFNLTRAQGTFRPYARVQYRHQLSGGPNDTVTAYFSGDTATTPTSFTVTGLGQSKNEVDANAGVNWVFDDAGSIFVGYQGTMRRGHSSHGINFGIRLEF